RLRRCTGFDAGANLRICSISACFCYFSEPYTALEWFACGLTTLRSCQSCTCAEAAMLIPSSIRNWLRLPGPMALLLGLGALSAPGAKADTGEAHAGRDPVRVPQQSVKTFGDLLIWSEEGRIYVAEPGKQAQELALGDTTETRHLQQLLQRAGTTSGSPHA